MVGFNRSFSNIISINFIIGISQRDSENYYEFIASTADEIIANLLEFFNTYIQNKFLSADFVVDIYRKNAVSFLSSLII